MVNQSNIGNKKKPNVSIFFIFVAIYIISSFSSYFTNFIDYKNQFFHDLEIVLEGEQYQGEVVFLETDEGRFLEIEFVNSNNEVLDAPADMLFQLKNSYIGERQFAYLKPSTGEIVIVKSITIYLVIGVLVGCLFILSIIFTVLSSFLRLISNALGNFVAQLNAIIIVPIILIILDSVFILMIKDSLFQSDNQRTIVMVLTCLLSFFIIVYVIRKVKRIQAKYSVSTKTQDKHYSKHSIDGETSYDMVSSKEEMLKNDLIERKKVKYKHQTSRYQ